MDDAFEFELEKGGGDSADIEIGVDNDLVDVLVVRTAKGVDNHFLVLTNIGKEFLLHGLRFLFQRILPLHHL